MKSEMIQRRLVKEKLGIKIEFDSEDNRGINNAMKERALYWTC